LLANVPAEYVFRCQDGHIYGDMKELADGLSVMSDETYTYHSNLEKQDFSNWVRNIIKDEQLANDLARTTSRLQATHVVAARIMLLSSK
jgi:hypothetical protein